MANYAAENVSSSAGSTVTARTATSSSDTVPAGALVLWRNTGAGTHVVTLTNSATQDGLTVANRTISIPAGTAKAGRVSSSWGDSSGLVAVAVDGTANEVSYFVLGGI
jgi:hypothetical protein